MSGNGISQLLDGGDAAFGATAVVEDQAGVKAGESVLITADTASDMAAVGAVMRAARSSEAKACVMLLPQLPFQGPMADPFIPEPVVAAMRGCDVWLDFTFPYIAGSNVHDEAMKSNRIRYLLLTGLRSDGLAQLYGRVELDRLYEVQERLDAIINAAVGKECRITNEAGTDVTFRIAESTYRKPRRMETPGMYTPPGSSVLMPELESVRGVIAIDSIFHEYYTGLPSPITLEVDGLIRSVRGGGPDRFVLERSLRRAGGGEYGYIIHFTVAFNPAATFNGVSFLQDARTMGSNAVGMGLPWWLPGGGENHPDALVTMQSLWIDGEQITAAGKLIAPPEVAALAEGLEPIYR